MSTSAKFRENLNYSSSRSMAFTRNVLWQRLTIISSEYHQICDSFTTPDGWKAELSWATRVQIICPKLLLDSGPGGTRTRDLWVTSPRPCHYSTQPKACRDMSTVNARNDTAWKRYRIFNSSQHMSRRRRRYCPAVRCGGRRHGYVGMVGHHRYPVRYARPAHE